MAGLALVRHVLFWHCGIYSISWCNPRWHYSGVVKSSSAFRQHDNYIAASVRDLLRAGVIKPNEKPVWFDVYAAFPPKREPLYEKPPKRMRHPPDNVPVILYQEDLIRAKFYEAYGNGPKMFELSRTNFRSTCQRFVDKYNELQKLGEQDEDKLFEEAGKALLAEGIILRRKGVPMVTHQQSLTTGIQDPVPDVNLKNMPEEEESSKLSEPGKQSTTS